MSKINVGDKVRIISTWDGIYKQYFNLGEIVTVKDVFNDSGKIMATNGKKSQILRSGHYTKIEPTLWMTKIPLYSEIRKDDWVLIDDEATDFHVLPPNSMAKVITVLKDQELKFVVEGISKRTGNTIEQTIYKDHIKAAWREPEQTTEQKPALTDEAITELADKINFIKRLKSELNILEARKEDLEETLTETEEALKTMKDDLGVE